MECDIRHRFARMNWNIGGNSYFNHFLTFGERKCLGELLVAGVGGDP